MQNDEHDAKLVQEAISGFANPLSSSGFTICLRMFRAKPDIVKDLSEAHDICRKAMEDS